RRRLVGIVRPKPITVFREASYVHRPPERFPTPNKKHNHRSLITSPLSLAGADSFSPPRLPLIGNKKPSEFFGQNSEGGRRFP
ncbi:MAG: hypothetical protein OJI67_01295, partial [Prosthecobacter sp.]|nr:hypothetical protein [Prosthecobacter sp.]